jgi:hypothetical protein
MRCCSRRWPRTKPSEIHQLIEVLDPLNEIVGQLELVELGEGFKVGYFEHI